MHRRVHRACGERPNTGSGQVNMTAPVTPSGCVRILVVDDHPFFREGIGTWIARQPQLEYCGYADTVGGAVRAIEQLSPDIVLLDLELRDGSGLDVLTACVKGGAKSRVIVVSQKEEALFGERALRAGACGYVMKAEASEVMLEAIGTVTAAGLYFNPATRRQLPANPSAAPTEAADKTRTLYNRERQVLSALGRGLSTKEIAAELNISPKTVESYRESLKKKLGFSNSLQLVRFATVWQHESG